jgi:RecJ-like exonuclease
MIKQIDIPIFNEYSDSEIDDFVMDRRLRRMKDRQKVFVVCPYCHGNGTVFGIDKCVVCHGDKRTEAQIILGDK